MLIEQTLFGTIDKVQTAIDRLKAFEPKDRPYWLAFSGGKDSCVILELAKMAGVRFEAHYNCTSVDPPELVRFIKREHPEVSFDIPHDRNGRTVTMWTLLKNNSMPPTQVYRYCCRALKESSGKGTVTITGVRWAESINRKLNQGPVVITGTGAERVPEVQAANFTSTARGGWC
jgi:phosphoadenosine phosphosulfate reductase